MRNFKKVMALVISMAAIATTVSAAELTYEVTGLTGSYDKEANTLTLTVDGATGDKTVLVLDKDANEDDVAGDDILYINQYADGDTAYDKMGLKGTTALAEGRYRVKIWYSNAADDAILEGEIVVAPGEDEGQKITLVYGDVTADNLADAEDALSILSKAAGGSLKAGTSEYEIGSTVGSLVYGDVTADNLADAEDALSILSKAAGGSLKAGTSEYEIGSTVEVIIK